MCGLSTKYRLKQILSSMCGPTKASTKPSRPRLLKFVETLYFRPEIVKKPTLVGEHLNVFKM